VYIGQRHQIEIKYTSNEADSAAAKEFTNVWSAALFGVTSGGASPTAELV
jgi:hypothetical protein